MYTKSAELYDHLYHFKNYEVASQELRAMIGELLPGATSLLDVACATGRHLAQLAPHFEVEGLDINPALLEVARRRLPGVRLHEGDMMAFDLGRRFDVVTCLFSSIAYSRTPANLARAVSSMARHISPGGLLFVEPWLSPEQYWRNNIVLNTSVDPSLKIAWMYVGTEKDNLVTNDIHFMVGTPDGVSQFSETHHMGLFNHQNYVDAIAAAGLDLLHHDAKGFFGNGLYVSRRQGADNG